MKRLGPSFYLQQLAEVESQEGLKHAERTPAAPRALLGSRISRRVETHEREGRRGGARLPSRVESQEGLKLQKV